MVRNLCIISCIILIFILLLANVQPQEPQPFWIIFASFIDMNNSDIYVIDSNGNNLRRITNTPGWECCPSLSPDGQKIVFSNGQIAVMDTDGNNVCNLSDRSVFDDSPAWSPDGQRIAFARSGIRNTIQIYVIGMEKTYTR